MKIRRLVTPSAPRIVGKQPAEIAIAFERPAYSDLPGAGADDGNYPRKSAWADAYERCGNLTSSARRRSHG
jgi:hypothetical protein